MTWQPTRPSTEDTIAAIPSILHGNWEEISTLFGTSHYGLDSTLSGRHHMGQPGIVYTGSQTAIEAITTTVSGALSLASGTGIEHYYSGSWRDIGRRGWSHARAYLSESLAFSSCTTSSTDTQTVIFGTEEYDDLGEYNVATGAFVVSASGPYIIIASLCLCGNTACASTVTASPSADEYLSQMSSPGITASTVGSADRLFDWSSTDPASSAYQILAIDDDGTTCICAYSPTSEGTETILGFASLGTSTNQVKILAGATSADLASVTVSATVNRVTTSSASGKFLLQIGSTSYLSEPIVFPSTGWPLRGYTWTTNPRTSAAWTADDLFGVSTSAISGFGFNAYAITGAANALRVSYAYIQYNYRLKNYSLVSDGSNSTYVFNSAYPSAVGDVPLMDIFAANAYSSVFPYNMPISSVNVVVKAAGGTSDTLYGILQFPPNASIPGSSYTVASCAIDCEVYQLHTHILPSQYSYVDQTLSANNATTNDVFLPYRVVGIASDIHSVYCGHGLKFNSLEFNIGTALVGTGVVATYEYWNGTAWVVLSVTDGTNSFKNVGTNSVSFTPPNDWDKSIISDLSSTSYYWLRVSVTADVITVYPLATQIWVHPHIYTNTSSQVLCAKSDGSTALCAAFREYETTWVNNPCLGVALTATSWTAAQVNASGASAISGWGYDFGYATSGASASEAKMYVKGLLVPQEVRMDINKGGSMFRRVYSQVPVAGVELDHTINFFDTVYLTAGDSLTVSLTKSTYNDVLSAGSDRTFFSISRISGRCF